MVSVVSLYSLNSLPPKDEILGRIQACCEQYQQTQRSAFALIDIDDFGAINDAYGFFVADRILEAFAQTALSVFEEQFVGRWNSDEFVVVSDDVNSLKNKCLLLMSKVREEQSLTLSVGLTTVRISDDVVILFSRLRQAMFEAKAKGKNTVVEK